MGAEMKKLLGYIVFAIFGLSILLAACTPQADEPVSHSSSGKLQVVATTTIVADVVSQVGGDLIDLSVLLPVGVDPHSFDPTPQDIAKVADADLVFANGAGLEAFLDVLLESAGASEKIVHVSEGIELRSFTGLEKSDEEHAEEESGEEHAEDDEHEHEGADPHTWVDPNNVLIWVQNIAQALGQQDPSNASAYTANAEAYSAELRSLDAWVREQTALVPEANRQIVSDHTLLGYFADEYGFTQVGALIPGYSTLTEPTAKELAELEDAIHALDVKAVFVGNTVNPTLAERVTEDTGAELVYIYTGSLSAADGEAASYLDYIRYNVNAIVGALK